MAQRAPRPHHRHQKRRPSPRPLPASRHQKNPRIPKQSTQTIKRSNNKRRNRRTLPDSTKIRRTTHRNRSQKQTPQSRHRLLEIPSRNHGRTTRQRKPHGTRPPTRTRKHQPHPPTTRIPAERLHHRLRHLGKRRRQPNRLQPRRLPSIQKPNMGHRMQKASEAPPISKPSSHG